MAMFKEREDGHDLFQTIVSLKTGEAVVFSQSAISTGGLRWADDTQLRTPYVRVRTRERISADGGQSVLAK